MDTQPRNIGDLHAEHRQWQENLLFYQDELNTFRDRLREVASKGPSTEVTAWIEHFRNQFVIQQQLMDEITRSIRSHEHAMKELLAKDASAMDHALAHDHAEERGKMQVFTKFYQQLKNDLTRFLSNNLVEKSAG